MFSVMWYLEKFFDTVVKIVVLILCQRRKLLFLYLFFFQLTTCRVQEITIDILKLVSEEAFK